MTTAIINHGRRIAVEREIHKRRNEAGEYQGPSWLERMLIDESRSVAAATLRMVASGLEVDARDVRWACEWVAADEGWDPRWAPGSLDLMPERVAP